MKNYLIIGAIAAVAVTLFFIYKPSVTPDTEPLPETGRLVLAVTNQAADTGSVSEVRLTTNLIRVQSPQTGWVTLSEKEQTFELLELREGGILALLAEQEIEPGTYTQIRIAIEEVTVIDAGEEISAKLPSNDLRLNTLLRVLRGETSSMVIDFEAGASLHRTDAGNLIFTPVVKLKTAEGADVEKNADGTLAIAGGVGVEKGFGMNEEGLMAKNFMFSPAVHAMVEVVDGFIKIIPKTQQESDARISATEAAIRAVEGGYVAAAHSVKLTMKNGEKTWRVIGPKNDDLAHVYVDTDTGSVIAVE